MNRPTFCTLFKRSIFTSMKIPMPHDKADHETWTTQSVKKWNLRSFKRPPFTKNFPTVTGMEEIEKFYNASWANSLEIANETSDKERKAIITYLTKKNEFRTQSNDVSVIGHSGLESYVCVFLVYINNFFGPIQWLYGWSHIAGIGCCFLLTGTTGMWAYSIKIDRTIAQTAFQKEYEGDLQLFSQYERENEKVKN